VIDRNDHVPQFVFPSDVNHTVFVSPRVVVGERLAKLEAEDSDLGNNANLTFFIDDDEYQLGLGVEPTSGLLISQYNEPIKSSDQKLLAI